MSVTLFGQRDRSQVAKYGAFDQSAGVIEVVGAGLEGGGKDDRGAQKTIGLSEGKVY